MNDEHDHRTPRGHLIRVDRQVKAFLEEERKGSGETPNQALRRLLGIQEPAQGVGLEKKPRLTDLQEKLLESLGARSGMTIYQIAEATGTDVAEVYRALASLHNRGLVTRSRPGRYHQWQFSPEDGW